MINEIGTEIHNWLAQQIKTSDFNVIQLAGDASARRYYRIIYDEQSWVLMSWEPFAAKNYPFLSVQKHFGLAGVQVPEVVAINEGLGLLLLEDLGDLTLERKFWEGSKPEFSKDFYLKTIDELIKIHDVSTYVKTESTALTTEFDTAKFMWEMNYAKEHLLLGLLKIKLTDADSKKLNDIFLNYCEKLHKEPKVVCHRDFHSRNVMIKLDKICIIDFQDARLGPVQYDLVSLFRDSYVSMNKIYSNELLKYYLDNSKVGQSKDFNKDHFMKIYELQSLQRCFKACGSFASFMNTRQDRRYLKYLSPTLKKVMQSLTHFPEYNLLTSILVNAGAFEKNYENIIS